MLCIILLGEKTCLTESHHKLNHFQEDFLILNLPEMCLFFLHHMRSIESLVVEPPISKKCSSTKIGSLSPTFGVNTSPDTKSFQIYHFWRIPSCHYPLNQGWKSQFLAVKYIHQIFETHQRHVQKDGKILTGKKHTQLPNTDIWEPYGFPERKLGDLMPITRETAFSQILWLLTLLLMKEILNQL